MEKLSFHTGLIGNYIIPSQHEYEPTAMFPVRTVDTDPDRQMTHKKRKKVNKFHVLKFWIFSLVGWRLSSPAMIFYKFLIHQKA
jgi:hypothetical protein